MPYAALSPPPGLQSYPLGYTSCWRGPLSLVPLFGAALVILAATIILARMWFTPGPMARRDRLGEIGLFAAAGLAWGLAWVAVPGLIIVILPWWDAVSRGRSLWAAGPEGTVVWVLVVALMLAAVLLRMRPMQVHVAAVRARWTSWRHVTFVACTIVYGLSLPIALLTMVIAGFNANGFPCDEYYAAFARLAL